jgi:hypothetical protein
MGYDLAHSVNNFTIGCYQRPHAPMFLWMQSGTRVAYAKVMAEEDHRRKDQVLVALGLLPPGKAVP